MDFTSDVITIDIAGHIATVWLDRPDRLNAMGREFWDDLPRAMQTVGDDDTVRVVVVAGKGTAFTAGLDLVEFGGEFGPSGDSPAAAAKQQLAMIKRMQATMSSLAECPKPVIAAIHGYCLGGGIDLITAADIRLAASDAVFSVRETKIAIVADVGTLQRLPKVLSAGHVAELAYTGKDIGAERAKEIGLVNDVHPDREAVLKAAYEMAEEIAANSPLVVQGVKHILRKGDEMTVDQALDYMALYNASFLRSADLLEAMQAYAEKRPPNYTGQ